MSHVSRFEQTKLIQNKNKNKNRRLRLLENFKTKFLMLSIEIILHERCIGNILNSFLKYCRFIKNTFLLDKLNINIHPRFSTCVSEIRP